jgi:hypothetical protein
MAHFIHVVDEMGRNTFNRFGTAREGNNAVSGRKLPTFLLHRYTSERLDVKISVNHVPDRVGIHCFATSFGDVLDGVVHHQCVVVGLCFGEKTDEIVAFLPGQK